MTLTRRSPSDVRDSRTVLVIGQGDGKLIRRLAKEHERVVWARWPDEPKHRMMPGEPFEVTGPTAAQDMVSALFSTHEAMLSLSDMVIIDQHTVDGVKPSQRAEFSEDLFTCLERKPLEFGDDILDGFQGVFHTAQNAKKLLASPTPVDLGRGKYPAISIACGPSLSRHLPRLRQLQTKCLLVCADSALDGLLDAGITPHLVTPMERIPEVMKAFRRKSYPGVTFAGLPVVRKEVVDLFDKHWLVPATDIHMAWMLGNGEHQAPYGQSTGTMCMALACMMTSGPVYLVGHDLAYDGERSHWDGTPMFHRLGGQNTVPVRGHHGMLRADYYWDMYRRQIEGFAALHGNVINVNHYDSIGAIIENCRSDTLPDPLKMHEFRLPKCKPPEIRGARFFELLKRLPQDADHMLANLVSVGSLEHRTSLPRLCPSDNWMMWAYCLRSLLAEMSYGAQTDPQEAWIRFETAMRSVIKELRPTLVEMAGMYV